MSAVSLVGLVVAGVADAAVPQLTVTPSRALIDTPVNIRVSGLPPWKSVLLTGTTVDRYGNTWTSQLAVEADGRGVVETHSNMRLFWSMSPVKQIPEAQQSFYSKDGPTRVRIRARIGGRVVASGQLIRRRIAADLERTTTTLTRQGFVGVYATRPNRAPVPATLVIGGALPGYSSSLSLHLASNGYPSLAIGYWGMAGLPPTLENVRLEYFEKALRWLAQQPGVDPNRIAVIGISRGEEAALLLAIHYPRLVHGAVGCTGSEQVLAGFPSGPTAWTLRGKPIPNRAIPVEQIPRPVLVTGGGEDEVWPSALAVQRILERADAHHATNIAGNVYPAAGHGIGCLLPNQPMSGTVQLGPNTFAALGGTPAANAQATARAWPRLLRFLSELRP